MRKVASIDVRGKPRVQTVNQMPSKTVQSDAHLADITTILRQWAVGGEDSLDVTADMFRDISEFTDYADAMRHAKVAELEFMRLPSKVREIFHHDVFEWLDTAHDKEKRDALVKAGFLEGPREPEEIVVAGAAAKAAGSVADPPVGASGEAKAAEAAKES